MEYGGRTVSLQHQHAIHQQHQRIGEICLEENGTSIKKDMHTRTRCKTEKKLRKGKTEVDISTFLFSLIKKRI